MIECPNCGSFAQVEFDDYIDDFCGSIQAHYYCGCGAKFHITHYASNAVYIDELPKETNLSPLAIRMINQLNKDKKGVSNHSFLCILTNVPGGFTRAQICEHFNIYLLPNCKLSLRTTHRGEGV